MGCNASQNVQKLQKAGTVTTKVVQPGDKTEKAQQKAKVDQAPAKPSSTPTLIATSSASASASASAASQLADHMAQQQRLVDLFKKELETKEAKLKDGTLLIDDSVLKDLILQRESYDGNLKDLRDKHENVYAHLEKVIKEAEERKGDEIGEGFESIQKDKTAPKGDKDIEEVKKALLFAAHEEETARYDLMPESLLDKQQSSTDETDIFMFPNDYMDTVVTFSESSKKLQTLKCSKEQYISYTQFASCLVDSCLFQLGGDSTCQVLIPAAPEHLSFALYQRLQHPYRAMWHKATLIALPDKKVLVCGIKWDSINLSPWIHSLKTNKWTYKQGDINSEPLPAQPCVRESGSGCLLGHTIYLFGGMSEQNKYLPHIDRCDTSNWSGWEKIQNPSTQQLLRLNPFVAKISDNECLIFGGKNGSRFQKDVLLFNSETQIVGAKLSDTDLPNINFPCQSPATNKNGEVLAFDSNFKRLVRVTKAGEVTTVAEAAEVENQASTIPAYDSNVPLGRGGPGVGKLTSEQTVLFDQWWEEYMDFVLGGNREQLQLMMVAHRGTIKKIFEKHTDENIDGQLERNQQEVFLTEIWHKSRTTYPAYPRIEEPAGMLQAKIKAVRSLSQGDSFSWKDFKRAYRMLDIWCDGKRQEHTKRVRAAAQ